MKAKRYIITLVQLLCLILLSVALFFGYQTLVKPTTVYVFTQDIDSGIKISSNMVKAVKVPYATLSTGNFITEAKNLSGKATTGKVFSGQYIMKKNLVDSDKVSPFADSTKTDNLRKVAIQASFDTAAGGTLQKGDVVDLLVSKQVDMDSNGEEKYETKTFLKDVLVYNVIDSDGNTYLYNDTKYEDIAKTETVEQAKKKDDESVATTTIETVVLAVSPGDAETIINNSKEGTISIVTQFTDN